MMTELSPLAWTALAVGALLVGFSKTAVPGVNTVSVALYASVLPARHSTGVLLVLLMVGDAFAVWTYRRHAHWPTLVRLIPAVTLGMVLGAAFLALAADSGVKRVIGVILLGLTGVTLWRRGHPATAQDRAGRSRWTVGAFGSLGGFATMVANSGGPVMSMYFLAARFPVHAFLGTAAWFFAALNMVKLPISVGLGLVTPQTLHLDLILVPGVLVGALGGRWVARRINQNVFDAAVIVCTALGAVYLIVQ